MVYYPHRPDSPLGEKDDNCSPCLRFFKRQNRLKLLLTFLVACILLFMTSFDTARFNSKTLDISKEFSYPMEFTDFPKIVDLYRAGILNESTLQPINVRYSKIEFLKSPITFKEESLGFLMIVKSARRNYEKRDIIRETWADPKYLKETALSSQLPNKVLFICGKNPEADNDQEYKLEEKYKDIIIADFNDTYRNNTYKSLLAFKWALTELQGDFKYFGLFDDDIYVDLVNMRKYLRELPNTRVKQMASPYSGFPYLKFTQRRDEKTVPVSKLTHGLYLGRVYHSSPPERSTQSKWYVSYKEYNYNIYPPYLPGAGMILDRKAISDLYYASHFLEYLWIDDVYLGIVAFKMGIVPIDSFHYHTDLGVNFKMSEEQIFEILLLHGLCPAQIKDFWTTREFKNIPSCSLV